MAALPPAAASATMRGRRAVQPERGFQGPRCPHRQGYTTQELPIALPQLHLHQEASGGDTRQVLYMTVTDTHVEVKAERLPVNRLLLHLGPGKLMVAKFQLGLNSHRERSTRIQQVLQQGVRLGSKLYRFLGCSQGGLQDKACYLVQAETEQEVHEVRAQHANFADIKPAAKCLKRIGLLLSSVRPMHLGLQRPIMHQVVPDNEHDGYCYTDGCGMHAPHIGKETAAQLGVVLGNGRRYVPSVLQWRYREFKGITHEDRDVPAGLDFSFRKSMAKLKMPTDSPCAQVLGLVDWSKPYQYGRLNAQIIMLLSALGIPDEVLERKQQEYLDMGVAGNTSTYVITTGAYSQVQNMLTDEETAVSFLAMNDKWEAYAQLLEHGLLHPDVRSCLKELQSKELASIEKKKPAAAASQRHQPAQEQQSETSSVGPGASQQPAPPLPRSRHACDGLDAGQGAAGQGSNTEEEQEEVKEAPHARLRMLVPQSRLAFIVPDPTGQLMPGQCFFQPTIRSQPTVLVGGKLLAARNPCYHVGDLPVLTPVDVPELHHLRDVLVLPVTGKRPEADKMAGGDYDGDKAFVCWDPELVPRSSPDPPEYRAAAAAAGPAVTEQDLIHQFATHSNALLGRLNNYFLYWAALKGADCEECVAIALIFSRGVDSVKSGEKSVIPPRLIPPSSPLQDTTHHVQAQQAESGSVQDQVPAVARPSANAVSPLPLARAPAAGVPAVAQHAATASPRPSKQLTMAERLHASTAARPMASMHRPAATSLAGMSHAGTSTTASAATAAGPPDMPSCTRGQPSSAQKQVWGRMLDMANAALLALRAQRLLAAANPRPGTNAGVGAGMRVGVGLGADASRRAGLEAAATDLAMTAATDDPWATSNENEQAVAPEMPVGQVASISTQPSAEQAWELAVGTVAQLYASPYQQFELLHRFGKAYGIPITDLVWHIDFGTFNHVQRAFARKQGIPEAMLYNAVNRTELLQSSHIKDLHMGTGHLHWKLFQKGDGSATQDLMSDCLQAVHTAVSKFDKKLLLLRTTEPDQVLGIYLPRRYKETSDMQECGEGVVGFVFFGNCSRKIILEDHQLECTPNRLQVFRNHNKAQSYWWLAVKPGSSALVEGSRRGRGRQGSLGQGRGRLSSTLACGPHVGLSVDVQRMDKAAFNRACCKRSLHAACMQTNKAHVLAYELYVINSAVPVKYPTLRVEDPQHPESEVTPTTKQPSTNVDTGEAYEVTSLSPPLVAATSGDVEQLDKVHSALATYQDNMADGHTAVQLLKKLAEERKLHAAVSFLLQVQGGFSEEALHQAVEVLLQACAVSHADEVASQLLEGLLHGSGTVPWQADSTPSRSGPQCDSMLEFLLPACIRTGLLQQCPAVAVLLWQALQVPATCRQHLNASLADQTTVTRGDALLSSRKELMLALAVAAISSASEHDGAADLLVEILQCSHILQPPAQTAQWSPSAAVKDFAETLTTLYRACMQQCADKELALQLCATIHQLAKQEQQQQQQQQERLPVVNGIDASQETAQRAADRIGSAAQARNTSSTTGISSSSITNSISGTDKGAGLQAAAVHYVLHWLYLTTVEAIVDMQEAGDQAAACSRADLGWGAAGLPNTAALDTAGGGAVRVPHTPAPPLVWQAIKECVQAQEVTGCRSAGPQQPGAATSHEVAQARAGRGATSRSFRAYVLQEAKRDAATARLAARLGAAHREAGGGKLLSIPDLRVAPPTQSMPAAQQAVQEGGGHGTIQPDASCSGAAGAIQSSGAAAATASQSSGAAVATASQSSGAAVATSSQSSGATAASTSQAAGTTPASFATLPSKPQNTHLCLHMPGGQVMSGMDSKDRLRVGDWVRLTPTAILARPCNHALGLEGSDTAESSTISNTTQDASSNIFASSDLQVRPIKCVLCVEGEVVRADRMEVEVEIQMPAVHEPHKLIWRLDRLGNMYNVTASQAAVADIASKAVTGAATATTRAAARQSLPVATAGDQLARILVQTWADANTAAPHEPQQHSQHRKAMSVPPTPLSSSYALEASQAVQDGGVHISDAALEGCNDSQAQAIQAAARQRITLTWGPPGTGKTHTIVQLLLLELRQRKAAGSTAPPILVAAETHVAVDNVLRKLWQQAGKSLDLQPQQLLRVGDVGSVAEDIVKAGHCLESIRDVRLPSGYYNTTVVARALKQAVVVFTTCSGAASKLFGNMKFPSVIIDEAGQVTEPCSLCVLCLGAEQVRLVADPQQLGPCVNGESQPLALTLFERLQHVGLQTFLLDTQYRMHPIIAAFPSQHVYGGRLKTHYQVPGKPGVVLQGLPASTTASTTQRLGACSTPPWPLAAPLTFLHVDGPESGCGTSKTNYAQAREAARLAQRLLSQPQGGLRPADIGIIVMYKAMVFEQRQQLALAGPATSGVEVDTVDAFQGREKPCIIVCTVRSNIGGKLGFLEDMRRANVALTRAQHALVVIGNRNTLAGKSEPSGVWARWLYHFQQRMSEGHAASQLL